jgi:hypothetical protein
MGNYMLQVFPSLRKKTELRYVILFQPFAFYLLNRI